jgi:hypothetical protein
MKRGLVVMVLLIAGCGTSTPPAPTATTTSHSTADTAYLTRVRQSVTGATDADLIKAGRHACDLRKHGDELTTAEALTKEGFDDHAASVITTSAEAVYCP